MGGSQARGEPRLTAFVALMRGVNVGGANRLAMSDVRALFAALGASRVETYIQSGNVVFAAPEAEGARIAAEAQRRLGTPVALLEARALRAIVTANPFVARGESPKRLHAAFFSSEPDPERLAGLDPHRWPPDEFFAGPGCLYLCLPNGVARSKLTNAWLDSSLGVVTTVRNWATTSKLAEAAASVDRAL